LRDIERVGQHQFDAPARHLRNLSFPIGRKRIGRRHRQRRRADVDRQDIEPRRIAGRHHVRYLGEVDFQGIDADERDADLGGAPFGEDVERQQAVRRLVRDQLALGDACQRMHRAGRVFQDALGLGEVRLDLVLLDDAVGQQPGENGL
jgi:hypothetical protein